MTRKHYVPLARIVGETLAVALQRGGEDARTETYEVLYRPLVAMLAADNERFSYERFSYAVGTAETALLATIRAHDAAEILEGSHNV